MGKQYALKPPLRTQMVDELFISLLASEVGRVQNGGRPKVKYILRRGLCAIIMRDLLGVFINGTSITSVQTACHHTSTPSIPSKSLM